MAHLLEQMFSVKETPWHGLGRIIQEAPTSEDAIRLAGLDWKVIEQPIYRDAGATLSRGIDFQQVPSHKALIRSSDQTVLGVLGENYTPLQNAEAFAFFNPFIESGLATFETAGSLRGGKTVWVLARLNKSPLDITPGDAVRKYLMLSHAHDGTMAIRTGFTPIRIVCANTLAMSVNSKDSKLLRIMHSKQVKKRLDQVQEIVNAADAKFEATAEQYRALTRTDVDQEALKKYVEIVFEFSAVEDDRRALTKQKTIDNVTRLFETGRGNQLVGARGTYWGLYNAVTEYLSYEQGRSQETRLNHLWFGGGRQTNQRALNTALEAAVA